MDASSVALNQQEMVRIAIETLNASHQSETADSVQK